MSKIKFIIGRLNVFARLRWQEDRIRELNRQNAKLKLLCHQQHFSRLSETQNTPRRVHFIHIFGTGNIGDEFCGAEFYFYDFFRGYDRYVHLFSAIDFSAIRRDDVVIIGGGGLLNYSDVWNERIVRCMELSDYVVLWGCGFNHHMDHALPALEIPIERAALAGVRDYRCGKDYLPCVSCMLPDLNRSFPLKRRIGVAEHKDFPINAFPEYDKISNGNEDINTVLQFIGSSEVIITNTYHIWYWATLMNKKVILYGKFSTKFDHLRYEPVMYSGNLEQDIARCKTHPEALEEAVSLNRAFADKVMELLRDK